MNSEKGLNFIAAQRNKKKKSNRVRADKTVTAKNDRVRSGTFPVPSIYKINSNLPSCDAVKGGPRRDERSSC